jgi:hypothetical protein
LFVSTWELVPIGALDCIVEGVRELLIKRKVWNK